MAMEPDDSNHPGRGNARHFAMSEGNHVQIPVIVRGNLSHQLPIQGDDTMTKRLDCDSSPSGELLQAFGEFNRGDWFDCHETLEELWVGSELEMRWFYQGMLQIAVALHHWRNGNHGGAVSLLTSGVDYLRRVSPVCQRIEVAQLADDADRCRAELVRLGAERMTELPPALIPKMRLAPA